MSRQKKPFIVAKRNDCKTYFITINPTSGLPARVCYEWQRASFQRFPDELSEYRAPKTRSAANIGALALIQYLKKELEDGRAARKPDDEITTGEWLEKFTTPESSPRAARNIAKNRPNSIDTISNYESYFRLYIKDDMISKFKMTEIGETDILQFINRLSAMPQKRKSNATLGGTRTFVGLIKFMRMAFTEYGKSHPRWLNPFQGMDAPQRTNIEKRDALTEDEVIRLFEPGVLQDTMEVAVCAAIFWAGLRRGEVFALKPECLDWNTPKITVKNAWQMFDKKSRVLGPTKGKKERIAPFHEILQAAIKKLWEENGQHEFVFSFKDGKTPHASWIHSKFKKWLERAKIDTTGRRIVPHCSRHSLASLLEARGVSLRYIQELLGHSDLQTTKIYLHSTSQTIKDIDKKISEAITTCTKQPPA